jgi:hypothetical protein
VPGYATSFEAAPLDRIARMTTKTMWLAGAASVIAGTAVAALGSTDRQNVVLVDVGAARLALSPRDPDRFVAEVGRGA